MRDTLFDPRLGERVKARGLAQAGGAVRAWPWRVHAMEALRDLAALGEPFTADDVVGKVGLPDSGTNRNNAVGALFSAAAREGLIVRVGFRNTKRVAGHARVVSIWAGNPNLDLDTR